MRLLRRRPAEHRPHRNAYAPWHDLLPQPTTDDGAAALAVQLRAEAQHLAAALDGPTVLLGTVRVPGYLGHPADA